MHSYHRAVSHTLPFLKIRRAGRHGWLAWMACVRPSTALQHAARSVSDPQLTIGASLSRGVATRASES